MQRVRQVEHIAAHRIVNHIDAAPAGNFLDVLNPPRIGVGQGVVGPLLTAEVQLGLASGGRDNLRPISLPNLNRGHPHAAGARMHQQPFAVRQPRAAMQREVRRMIDHRHGGGFGEIHSRDGVKCAVRRRQRVFGEGAIVRHGRHRIAGEYVLHFGAHRVHDAGHFRARGERKGRPDLILALNLENVEEIERRGVVADAHFLRARLRYRNLVERHLLRFAERVNLPGFHANETVAHGSPPRQPHPSSGSRPVAIPERDFLAITGLLAPWRTVINMPEVIENTRGRVFITFGGPQGHSDTLQTVVKK